MTPEIERLLVEIDAYCGAFPMAQSTFATKAVNDGKFVSRLRGGGQCLPSTMARARDYMAANPPPEAERAEPQAANAA